MSSPGGRQAAVTVRNMLKTVLPVRYLKRSVRNLRFQKWLLEGEERLSKKHLSVLFCCAGAAADKTYLAELLFGNGCRETPVGTEWIWNLRRLMRGKPADIVVIGNAGPGLYRYISDGRDFYIPGWVRGEIVFSEAEARMKTSGHLKSDLRRIRKNAFEFELTRSPARFDDFYNTMYVPYISKAYGQTAMLMSHNRMKELAGQSELILVTQHGTPLAGQILVHERERDRIRCWSIGVKDGNHDYVKMGAQAALYRYEIQHLSEQGYKAMHVGASRAFLKDGVLRFKNKWGMRMLNPSSKGFLLKPLRKSEGAMSFFVNNPFIHLQDDKYTGIVFAEGIPDTDYYRDIRAQYCSPGLSKLRVYVNRGHDKNSLTPDGMEEGITTASIDALFDED
jgi:hypothetical protein